MTQARLGSTLFFVLSAAVGFCYLVQLARVWRAPANRRVLLIALAFAAACRALLSDPGRAARVAAAGQPHVAWVDDVREDIAARTRAVLARHRSGS